MPSGSSQRHPVKLTPAAVQAIRAYAAAHPEQPRTPVFEAMAVAYGVSAETIRSVVCGETWRDVDGPRQAQPQPPVRSFVRVWPTPTAPAAISQTQLAAINAEQVRLIDVCLGRSVRAVVAAVVLLLLAVSATAQAVTGC